MTRNTFRLRPGVVLILLLMAGSGIWTSCSNTKDTLVNRTFHNLSAHYNGYYNATVKLDEALDKLAASHTDQYDRPLRVFQYANAEKSKAIYPDMDDIIKRTSAVINRHTILDRSGNEKPNSEKWIDDNWLLYGKALFFKHEYFAAMEAFKYVESTYRKEPTRHLASLWIAKTYLELTQLSEAESKLDYVNNIKDFPQKNRWELAAVNADFYLQVHNFEKAVPYLKTASELAPKRDFRIRCLFILAQLNQQLENYPKAFELYTKVIKMNPKYEMSFNARINRAQCYNPGSKEGLAVKEELLKLEKDPKNKDYLDQLYYALAGLERIEGNDSGQVDYLNKSVRASTTNQNQKALSYLELGKIELKKPEYRQAQLYYDSTIANLATDHPEYDQILVTRNSLTKLIRYLNTIEKEDSLQQLAKLSPTEREAAVDKVLRDEEAARKLKEQEEKQQEQSNQIFDPSRQQETNQFNRGTGSSWYFYNTQAMSFGFNEFTKKWGDRKLEDNWRRSNKQSTLPDITEDQESGPKVTDEKEIKDPVAAAAKKKEDMLKSIPLTPDDIDKSTKKILSAYYNAALIYKEQLNDLNASTNLLEEMLRKYPHNKYEVQVMYQLYKMYAQMGNQERSDYYKNSILNQHGDTEYAEIIRNPNYAAEQANKKSALDIFYEETYRKYLNGEYADVMVRKAQAEQQWEENPLMPKFAFLKALAIGKTQSPAQFQLALEDVIRTYSSDPVKDAAQNILDYLEQKGVPGSDENHPQASLDSSLAPPSTQTDSVTVRSADNVKPESRTFYYMPDTTHYVVIVFQNIGGPVDGNKLKSKISDFNLRNYSQKGYTIMDLMFDHRNKMMVIKEFPNKAEALSYNSHLYNNDEVFGNLNPDAYKERVISINNFPEVIRQKKLDEYDDFYLHFYK